MSRPNVKASTSPSTPSAPTICKVLPGRGLPKRPCPELRFGHIPGNALTVEGLQRKLEPLSFFWRSNFYAGNGCDELFRGIRRDQVYRRKIGAIAPGVARKQRQLFDCRMGADKKIGQHTHANAAGAAVLHESFSRQK